MIKVKTMIGKQEIVVELSDMKAIHKFNRVYGSLPSKCTACGSPNVYISFKNPGGNDYYLMECGDCGADANFGIHKDGSGLFWKGEKMEKYVPQDAQQQGPQRQQPPQQQYPTPTGTPPNDLPF